LADRPLSLPVDTETVTLFFAFLATIAQVVVVLGVGLAVGSRLSPALAGLQARVAGALAPQALGLGAVVALTATLGSLYLSEVAHFPPCTLCWYQRIAMYPLVVILGIAELRRDGGARFSAYVLAGAGSAISIWHLVVEANPTLGSGSCDPTNPCSTKWVEEFGYLTIPGMALSGFLLIITLLTTVSAPSSDLSPEELS
jgi:disulfide bond formation protein DsbB